MEQSKQQPQVKRDVIKHSAAIQIQNNVTLLQRRAWNVLLANAYDELPIQDIHQISVQRLMMSLEFNSKNEDYLKEAIEALVGCRVKWNILDKDGSAIWGVAALLASAEIQRGVCTYGFAPHMRQRLHNPRMYARLCLSLQNKFDSKHTLALWEHCTDYLGAKRDCVFHGFLPPSPSEGCHVDHEGCHPRQAKPAPVGAARRRVSIVSLTRPLLSTWPAVCASIPHARRSCRHYAPGGPESRRPALDLTGRHASAPRAADS